MGAKKWIIAGVFVAVLALTLQLGGGSNSQESIHIEESGEAFMSTPLLYVSGSSISPELKSRVGSRTESIRWGENFLWPNGCFATYLGSFGQHEQVVNWIQADDNTPIRGMKTSHSAMGPDGLYAYIQKGADHDLIVVEYGTAGDHAAREYSRACCLNFDERGDLAFSFKARQSAPWRSAVWFRGLGYGQAPVMVPEVDGVSDMLFPSIGPDNRLLVFSGRYAAQGTGREQWDLWTWKISQMGGGNPSQLTMEGNIIDPDWGPGGLIAVTRLSDGVELPESLVLEDQSDSMVYVIDLREADNPRWVPIAPGQHPSWLRVEWLPRGKMLEPIPETPTPEPTPTPTTKCEGVTLQVVAVLDVSGSMEGQPLHQEQSGAHTVIDALRPQDIGYIVVYDDQIRQSGWKSGDETDTLKSSLGTFIAEGGGDTAVYDAINIGLGAFEGLQSGSTVRRLLIIFTDGEDNASANLLGLRPNEPGYSEKEAVVLDVLAEQARSTGVAIHSVGFHGKVYDGNPSYRPEPLKYLAEQTLGSYREAEEETEIAALFEAIAAEELCRQEMP